MQKSIASPNALLHIAICACLFSTAAPGQAAPPPPPAFEVVTIKPSDPVKGGMMGFYSYPGGRVLLGFANIKMIVQYAFNVQDFQVTGEPSWADSEHYDIVALPPDSSPSRTKKQSSFVGTPTEEQRQMLQSLLADRFALKYHRETRESSVLILGVNSSKKLQLQDAADRDKEPFGVIAMSRAASSTARPSAKTPQCHFWQLA
jgi:uncharacterized protein (TIGR03435 family)